ncbi:MAG: hypothetical protein J7L34_05985 [Thermotogaceae bacterium]|nr:hypothetical protein [Thermotogaceae bacterium]
MLLRAAVLILIIAFLYIFKIKSWIYIATFMAAGTIPFFFKEGSKKASSLNFLTLIFATAVLVLGSLKGIGTPGLFQLSLAILFTPLLSIKKKKYISSLPFWFFTGWAIGAIFAQKYGNWGYMLSLAAALLYIKDITEKEEKKDGKIQKTE